MRVYADLFFLLNAGADYALLSAAARLTGVRAPIPRLAAAAAGGGLYGVLALLVPALASLPGGLAVAALMVLAAFAPRPPVVLVRLLACLYGAAALAAGLALGLAARAGAAGIPWWVLLASLGAALIAASALYERWRPGGVLSSLCDVELTFGDRIVSCRALIDSGNSLSDGGVPAIVVAPDVLRPAVPAPVLAALTKAVAVGTPREWGQRVHLLPFRAVGTAGGVMAALRPDAVRVRRGREHWTVRAVVAVSPTPLDPGDAYQALVPPGLLPSTLRAPAPGLPVAAALPGAGRRVSG